VNGGQKIQQIFIRAILQSEAISRSQGGDAGGITVIIVGMIRLSFIEVG